MRKPPMVSHLPFDELKLKLEPHLAQALREDKSTDEQTRVYFVQESSIGAIKIGVSKHPKKRAKELQDHSLYVIKLLATVDGGYSVEHTLHHLFAHAYIRGEWFRPVDELIAYIAKEGEPIDVTEKRERDEIFEKMRSVKGLVAR